MCMYVIVCCVYLCTFVREREREKERMRVKEREAKSIRESECISETNYIFIFPSHRARLRSVTIDRSFDYGQLYSATPR